MRGLLALLVTASIATAAQPPAGFEVLSLKGFTVLVHQDVQGQPRDRHQRQPLDVLEAEFDDLKRVVPPRILALLQQVPVWVRWDSPLKEAPPGVVAMYFYGSAEQLTQIGRDKLQQNSIEILTLKRLGELRPPGAKFQQVITLHEMAHAVQHRLLGHDSAELKAAFQQAVERKLYDDVADRYGQRGRAYARTNAAEYFAEVSCAYLDSCHFYPFIYSDLREHDSAGFALMERVWKKPEQFAGRVPAVPTPTFSPAATVRSGPAQERDAFMMLDRGRALIRAGKSDEGRRALERVVKAYSGTLAAADARKLLAQSP